MRRSDAGRRWLRARLGGRRLLLGGLTAFAIMLGLPVSANAQLASTAAPYMGWNTYYGVGGVFNESTIKSVASYLLSSGLAQAGYKIVWLDFGWATGARDASGNLIVDPTQWPDGMAGLTAWLHQQGLQAGIYTDAGPSGCSGQGVGSYGHYQQDANQFAAWGFDAVKMDFCGAGQTWLDQPPNDPRTLYTEFSHALANNSSGRPMILNADNFWVPGQINGTAPSFADSSWDNYSWAPAVAQSWRTDTDIGGTGSIQFVNVLRNLSHDTGTNSNASQPGIQTAAGPPGSPSSSPLAWGHWNDPDYLGPGLGMTDTQAQSQFSMWAMVAAPLILGSDPRSLSSTSISMLENSQVIAIDQDPLGVQGYLLSGQGTTAQVWVKPLGNGDRAVALFNTATSSQQISTTASAIGMPSASQYQLVDVWTNQTSTTNGTITATVPADDVVLYRVSSGGGGSTGGGSTGGGSSGGGPSPLAPVLAPMTPALSLVAPSLSQVAQSHRRWREGNGLAEIASAHRAAPVGTIFRFALNESATVRFAFTQMLFGRKVSGRCVPRTGKNLGMPACTRTVTVGALSFIAGAGARQVRFQGRTSNHNKLKPGRYTLIITATNAAGQQATARLTFTIVT